MQSFTESKGQKGEGYSGYQRQGSRGFTEAQLPMHQRSAQQKETALELGCKKGTPLEVPLQRKELLQRRRSTYGVAEACAQCSHQRAPKDKKTFDYLAHRRGW